MAQQNSPSPISDLIPLSAQHNNQRLFLSMYTQSKGGKAQRWEGQPIYKHTSKLKPPPTKEEKRGADEQWARRIIRCKTQIAKSGQIEIFCG